MARAFISHSSRDKPFVLRLAKDLQENWIDVWVDDWELRIGDSLAATIESSLAEASHLILVLSEASLKSDWVKRELEFAANREDERLGLTIIPVRLSDVPLPDELQGKPVADFSAEYESGLTALLEIFSTAASGLDQSLPGRRYTSAMRGHSGSQSVPMHLSSLIVGGNEWAFAAAFEVLGEPGLRSQLTATLHSVLIDALKKLRISGPESLGQYLSIANSTAVVFKSNLGVAIDFPLGAKMSLLVQYGDTACVSTFGACSAAARFAQGEDYGVQRLESAYELEVPLADGPDPGLSMSAPLGFVTPTAEPLADWKAVTFATPGDLVALATFRFLRDDGFMDVGRRLVQEHDGQRVALMLAEAHVPPTADSLCGVLMREG